MRHVTRPQAPIDPADAPRAAHALALRWLSMRELAANALRKRLRDRGFDADIIEATVDRLIAARALDDERAVRACARTLVLVKRRGRQRAQRELETMGFAPELARRVLADIIGDEDEQALANRFLVARLRGARVIPDVAAYQRLYGALVRRGFSSAIVRTALNPFWKRGAEVPETDAD